MRSDLSTNASFIRFTGTSPFRLGRFAPLHLAPREVIYDIQRAFAEAEIIWRERKEISSK